MGENPALTGLYIFMALILPPLPLLIKFGIHKEYWICLILTVLGHIPGVIYSIYILLTMDDDY